MFVKLSIEALGRLLEICLILYTAYTLAGYSLIHKSVQMRYEFLSGTHIEVNRPLAQEEEPPMADYQGIRTLYLLVYNRTSSVKQPISNF